MDGKVECLRRRASYANILNEKIEKIQRKMEEKRARLEQRKEDLCITHGKVKESFDNTPTDFPIEVPSDDITDITTLDDKLTRIMEQMTEEAGKMGLDLIKFSFQKRASSGNK